MKPVRAALAAPADVSADTVMDCVNTVRFLAIDAINKDQDKSEQTELFMQNVVAMGRNGNSAYNIDLHSCCLKECYRYNYRQCISN